MTSYDVIFCTTDFPEHTCTHSVTLPFISMKRLSNALQVVLQRKDSLLVLLISTVIFFLLLLITQNGKDAHAVFGFTTLALHTKLSLFITTLFDISNTFTLGAFLLAFLGSLIGGINLSLAYTYVKIRGEVIVRSGLYSGLGLVAAFFGIGCAACGTALLSVMLGFLGFSTMLNVLPYQGLEIGYIGLIFLCIATYSLAGKVLTPNVC